MNMNIKNLLPGFVAATALISTFISTPAFAQYYGNVTQFDQRLPYQSMQPMPGQVPYQLGANQYQAVNQNGELYTPNINGVPLNPTTPRQGLDRHGFDGYGAAFNQFTTPLNPNYSPYSQPPAPYNPYGNVSQPQYAPYPNAYTQPINYPANGVIPNNYGGYNNSNLAPLMNNVLQRFLN